MKRSKTHLFASILSFALITAACTAPFIDNPQEPEDIPEDKARLNLRLLQKTPIKSSISPEETSVDGFQVMAYRKSDGKLITVYNGENVEDIILEFSPGEYNLYVTANMPGFEAPTEEADIESACYVIRSVSNMENSLPMCWNGSVSLKAGETTTVSAQLSRLVSKVGLQIDMGVLEGLDIVSVQMKQAAGHIRPFMAEGSRILSSDESIDGDYATEEDIRTLMDGDIMYFYVTENCQGELLEDNTNPWDKIPERLGDISSLCTYIEMTGKWNDEAFYEGNVIYRFYLGENATTDFSIKRNSIYNLTLYLDEESLNKMSWKIDTSKMEIIRWNVSASLYNNFHTPDNFYMTENILVEFSLDEKGQRYWNKYDNAFRLEGQDSQGRTLIRFMNPFSLGDGRYEALGTCIDAGEYDIMMINDKTGKAEYILGSGTVHRPDIVAGYDDLFTDNPVDAFPKETEFTINGDHMDICLYLTDNEGFNLNQGHFYGCDLSLCQWKVDITNSAFGHNLTEGAEIELSYGECMNDSYAVRYRINFPNEGKDKEWNKMLTESLGKGVIRLEYEDTFSGAKGSHPLGLYCNPISITFQPMRNSEYYKAQTEFMYVVDNTSNLPILIRGLKLNTLKDVNSLTAGHLPILCSPINNYNMDSPLLVSRMPYTVCSLESDAAYSFTYNNKRAYAAADCGILQKDIKEQTSMFHTFDIRLAYETTGWAPTITGNYNLEDISYGSSAAMNCGVIFHSYNNTRELYDSKNGTVVDFMECGDLLNQKSISEFNEIVEVALSIDENNELIATSSREIPLDISISGFLKGHTRCVSINESTYKVWGEYFENGHLFKKSQRITVGENPVAVDGKSIADSFERLREHEYYSKVNAENPDDFRIDDGKSTTLREYLKPFALELEITITSPDGIPVALTSFSGSAIYDFMLTERVTWKLSKYNSATIIPSTYNGFDRDTGYRGNDFDAETVVLTPTVKYNTQNIYYMSN